ncbi:hypothetical protein F3J24_18315 [Comamonas sp. Tr-654]|uniref:hypothetical protein n=1 Tax=Comamonas sp. Tr-654 TaxID=2608341 RepID=UPI0014221793|nr:hypothetical protein [Comamonas sp. Tr-654]
MLFVCPVMKTKAIAFLLTSICFATVSEKVAARELNSIASDVKKAVADSLQVYKRGGVSGLTDAVSDCWKAPRDFCLYLDFASHRIAVGATYTGSALDEYFYAASVSQRGRTWLAPNGRGQLANDQYLYAVDQVMSRTLISHRDKMFKGHP